MVAGRAGFEYHPLNGDARLVKKNAPFQTRLQWRGGRDSKIIPSMGTRGW